MKTFAGMFETHLTVRLPGRLGEGDEWLARWAERRGMKYTKILLELSLAWKILWLHTDGATGDGPRSKDLYDAVILAEDNRTQLSPGLLRKVMCQGATKAGAPAGRAGIELSPPTDANWSAFVAGNPGTDGSARDWSSSPRITAKCPRLTHSSSAPARPPATMFKPMQGILPARPDNRPGSGR